MDSEDGFYVVTLVIVAILLTIFCIAGYGAIAIVE